MSADIDVLVQGSSIMIESVSDRGDQWIAQNIPANTPRWSSAYVVDQQTYLVLQERMQRALLVIRKVG